jgi:hypothetical protein
VRVAPALPSHGRGHRFETCHAHQHIQVPEPPCSAQLPANCQQTTRSRCSNALSADRFGGLGILDDHLLVKPVRATPPFGEVVIGAGQGRGGVVRGCPLGTGQDRCEWHAHGTAGEEDVARTWRRRLPSRRGRKARRWWPPVSVASCEGSAAAMAAKSAQQPAGSTSEVRLAGTLH